MREVQGCREGDEVLVSGPIDSAGGEVVKDLVAMIEEVAGDGAILVWPHSDTDQQLPRDYRGELRFLAGTFTLKLVRREG